MSKRLKKKALLMLDGLPLIVHTYRRALISKKIDDVYVCTDSSKIIGILKKYKCKYIKTKKNFYNGTDRIASVCNKFTNVKFFVDIQGDEPLLNPNDIDNVIKFHSKNNNFDIVVRKDGPSFDDMGIVIKNLYEVKELIWKEALIWRWERWDN